MAKDFAKTQAKAREEVFNKLNASKQVDYKLSKLSELADDLTTKPMTGFAGRKSRKTKGGSFVYLFSNGTGEGFYFYSSEDLGAEVELTNHSFRVSESKDGKTFVWY